jgi:O-antigen biosynthesis protein
MPISAPRQPVAIAVLGMHRSGTSALTRLLNLLGCDLGRSLLEPSDDNPRGFWENQEIVDCHGELLKAIGSYLDDFLPLPDGWENRAEVAPYRARLLDLLRAQFAGAPLWAFKDPRTCRLLPLWHSLLDEAGASSRFILMVRHPIEVHQSLAQRSGYPINKSMLMSSTHMLQAERHTRGRTRAIVTYEAVMSDWPAAVQRIGQELQIDWPRSIDSIRQQAGEFLDPDLRHHRAENPSATEGDPDFARWAIGAYELIAAGAGDAAALDAIADEFRRAESRYLPWRPAWSMEQKLGQEIRWSKLQQARRDQAEARVSVLEEKTIEASARMTMAEARMAQAEARAVAAETRAASAEERAGHAESRAAEADLKAAIAQVDAERAATLSGLFRRWTGKSRHRNGKTPR